MKKLRIFGYAWHTAHQFSLMQALPEVNFYYLINRIKAWSEQSRPVPKNLFFVNHYEPGQYDLAILHLDQQCVFGDKKGIPYRMMNDQIQDIPKIVINHGTPYFANKEPEDIKELMRKYIGDNSMIVNSETAWREWGFGKFIIHGISASDFKPAAKKENRIITTISPNFNLETDGWAKYYNRYFFKDIKEKINIEHVGTDITFQNYEEYRKYLGESLIYFNPTIHSPMPRARTEAMLSGCCIVSTPYHDWDKYIVNGKNGFLIDGQNLDESVNILKWLRRNPSKAEKIGREGRKTAMYYFDPVRYRNDWLKTIKEALSGKIIDKETLNLKKQLEDLYYLIPGAAENKHWPAVLENILIAHAKKIKNL